MGAFHAYDIRGEYNVDLDRDFAYKAGYFLPELLKTKKVLVGRDMRVSSPEMHDWLLKGITDAGADVYDLGLSTTPMVYYATAKYGFEASVQITASHNPKEHNGMKVSRANALPVALDTGLGTLYVLHGHRQVAHRVRIVEVEHRHVVQILHVVRLLGICLVELRKAVLIVAECVAGRHLCHANGGQRTGHQYH